MEPNKIKHLLHFLSIIKENPDEYKKNETYQILKIGLLNENTIDLSDQNIFLVNTLDNKNKIQKIPEFIIKEQKNTLNFIKNNDKTIISAPTSFGKSKIIIDYIKESKEHDKHVIICPTIALNSEYFIKIKNSNIKCSTNTFIEKEIKVYILTPEKALMMIKNNKWNSNIPLFFKTVIFDEFYETFEKGLRHSIFYDAFHFFSKLSKKIIILMPLTAKLPEEVIKSDFKTKEIKLKATARYQITYLLKQEKEVYQYKIYKKFDGFYDENSLGFFVDEKTIDYIEEKNKNYDLNHLEMTFKIINKKMKENKELKHMILVKFPKDMPKISNELKEYLIKENTLTKKEINKTIWLKALITYAEKYMHNTELLESLKYGIAYHNGKMDKFIRWLIENAYKSNEIKILIANTTLTKGVNLSPNCLYMLNIIGSSSDSTLKSIERNNAIGRVGRLMSKNVGEVFWFLKATESGKKNIIRNTTINEIKKIEMPNKDELPKKIFKMDDLYLKARILLKEKKIEFKDELIKNLNNYIFKTIESADDFLIFIIDFIGNDFIDFFKNKLKYYFNMYWNNINYYSIYKNSWEKNSTIDVDGHSKNIQDFQPFYRDNYLFKIIRLYQTDIKHYFLQIVQLLIEEGIEQNKFNKESIEKYKNNIFENDQIINKEGWPDIFEDYYIFNQNDETKKYLNYLLKKSLENY